MTRAQQREESRRRIVDAAVETFADHGFAGASTRAIAARADVTQGLVSYHFASKDELWQAAADRVFDFLAEAFEPFPGESAAGAGDGRDVLRRYVEVNAAHPEIFHFIVDAGRHDDERMRWVVDRHLRPRFAQVAALLGVDDGAGSASLYYAIAGAASLLFAVAPECRRLTGAEPTDPGVVDRHVELLTELFAPAG